MTNRRLAATALKGLRQRLLARFPALEEVPSEAPWVQVFRHRLQGRTFLCVYWQFHERDDCFTLEVGWTPTGRLPDPCSGLDARSDPPPRRNGLSFRVGQFLTPPRDFWWDTATGAEFRRAAPRPTDVSPDANLDMALDDALGLVATGLAYVSRRAVESCPHEPGSIVTPLRRSKAASTQHTKRS